MKSFIIFCFTIYIVNAQQFNYINYETLNLSKTIWIMEEIIKKGDDFNELKEFLSDSSITSIDRSAGLNNDIEYIIRESESIVNHIKKNKFKEGYTIEDSILTEEGSNIVPDLPIGQTFHEWYFSYKIKIRSNATKDIIWFLFSNRDGGVWKFIGTRFCNNFPLPDVNEPCDKK